MIEIRTRIFSGDRRLLRRYKKNVFVIPTTIQPRPPLVGERVQDSSVLFN
jgi:hypothetical protein